MHGPVVGGRRLPLVGRRRNLSCRLSQASGPPITSRETASRIARPRPKKLLRAVVARLLGRKQ
jgi:hypothetical protein